jgi:hypothetical protein
MRSHFGSRAQSELKHRSRDHDVNRFCNLWVELALSTPLPSVRLMPDKGMSWLSRDWNLGECGVLLVPVFYWQLYPCWRWLCETRQKRWKHLQSSARPPKSCRAKVGGPQPRLQGRCQQRLKPCLQVRDLPQRSQLVALSRHQALRLSSRLQQLTPALNLQLRPCHHLGGEHAPSSRLHTVGGYLLGKCA